MNPISVIREAAAATRPWQAVVIAGCLTSTVTMIATAVWALAVPA